MSKVKVTWVKVAWPGELTENALPESTPKRVQGDNGRYYCLVRTEGHIYICIR